MIIVDVVRITLQRIGEDGIATSPKEYNVQDSSSHAVNFVHSTAVHGHLQPTAGRREST